MTHADYRLLTRIHPDRRADVTRRMFELEDMVLSSKGSAACVLGHNNGSGRVSDGSNGRVIVGIFRGGRWVTVMLRRVSQENTPQSLGVDRVIPLSA